MVQAAFGHDFKNQHFTLLDPNVLLLNHGSFGTTPTSVIEKQNEIARRHEWYPDFFETFEVEELYREQIQALSDYINVDARNMALVSNATTGVNIVIRSIPWNFSEDKVLFHSTSYEACKNTIKFMGEYFNLQYDVVELNYPLEDNEVLSKFEEKLSNNKYRLCMFDMISSMPGVKLPYEDLIKMCQKYDTMSLLDGAHAAGQVSLQFLDELQPDFMTTNLHKWLSVPKACALLYINKKHHGMIQTLPISWNYSSDSCQPIAQPKTEEDRKQNDNLLHNKFWFIGTCSYSQYLCISEAIRFRKEVCGGEACIRSYQEKLQKEAISAVIKEFGPGSVLLQNEGKSLVTPGLFNISLPFGDKYKHVEEKLINDLNYFKNVRAVCARLTMERKAYIPFFYHNGQLWVRFSVQIFNEIEDYIIGARIFKDTLIEVYDRELASEHIQKPRDSSV